MFFVIHEHDEFRRKTPKVAIEIKENFNPKNTSGFYLKQISIKAIFKLPYLIIAFRLKDMESDRGDNGTQSRKPPTEVIFEEIKSGKSDLINVIDASETRLLLKIEEKNQKVKELEEENQYLKGKLEKLERENKANNIIIYGAPKTILTVDALKIEINNLVGVNLDTQEKECYIQGNKLVVDNKKYSLEELQVLDVEEAEVSSIQSAPSTPTPSILSKPVSRKIIIPPKTKGSKQETPPLKSSNSKEFRNSKPLLNDITVRTRSNSAKEGNK
ncbi:unnamed protein product [Psylliodes chrysocephalus]|uniref:Uncharacterized protein n=1 Tax=Psylliodes chrysocephalus TaxID=3402493 RepID=A0A9P0D255_9CUCU|nr:unnamed protein product [Psylliodes chrysocephala]